MRYQLIGGHDTEIAQWATIKFGKPFLPPLSAFGIIDLNGNVHGAAIFNDFHGKGQNIELSYVGPGTITRNIIRSLIHYAFDECGASRVSAKTKDKPVGKLLNRIGFKFEGVRKRYWDTDALCYVLFPEDAKRWLQ